MTIGSLGKALASQAIESTKHSVMDAVRPAEPGKPADTRPAQQAAQDAGSGATGQIVIGQIQAMQRPLKEDQELAVTVRAGNEMLRVTEIFVPGPQVLVFSGLDAEGNTTRVISPVEAAQVVCKVVRIAAGSTPLRVNILMPKPQPKPAA